MMYVKDNQLTTVSSIRKSHPNISFPDGCDLSFLGYAEFVETPPPSYDKDTSRVEASIADNQRVWTVIALTDAEKAEIKASKDAAERAAFKAARQAAVDAIKVTTSTGKTFDGDEIAQTRMDRAIFGMQAAQATTIGWTLADNSTVDVTLAELTEALILAGQEQARLWVQS